MPPTVKDACELHPMALDYAMGEQIENISDAVALTDARASAFFEKNFVTQGMRILLDQGLRRLAGRSDQAVFELKQAMGGGKTHSMIALGLLARHGSLRAAVVPEIARDAAFGAAKLVAINGRSKFHETFLWGEIAIQLGKAAEFSRFWRETPKAPSETDWTLLIGDEPTLILLDELPPYFDYAITQPAGGGTLAQVTTYALSNLLSAALKLKRCCIIISNLSGSYDGASQQLHRAIHNFEQEANRQARAVTPVDLASGEIYDILRKRLFKRLPSRPVVESIAAAFSTALDEAATARAIPKTGAQIAGEIHASYPFHPSVKHVVALFKENESYRQTRGLMQFVGKMLKSVWERRTNDVYLVGCQHLNLNIADVREEINKISNLQGAIAHDIASDGAAVAELVDRNLGSDAASQIASLLLTASLSESVDAVKGFTEPQFLECLIGPNRTVNEFKDAFEALRSDAWYLHRKESGAWYFSNIENLRKAIESRAENAPQPRIDGEMKRRLEEIFKPVTRIAYQEVQALPKVDDIRLNGPRLCLVISPDSRIPPAEVERFWQSVIEKNNVCVVAGDASDLASLEEKTRRIWAVARVFEETGGEASPHRADLEREIEQAEYDFNATVVSLFNRVFYPIRGKLAEARLSMTFTANQFKGEEQIEKALADVSVSKLYRSVEEAADGLIKRAEELLWPAGGERRVPWRDVCSRAISNERWPWLPPKGLETLRSIALGQGKWRDCGDGYVEKGPFPKPRTGVSVSQRDYKDETGFATIEILARDAGPNGRVHYGGSKEVSAASPVVPDTIWTTDATLLWFVAVDPDGEHETGEPVCWTNTLTLTHQPRELHNAHRQVELTVKPRGTIRWNATGANPRDGEVYNGPIMLNGGGEVTIYAYAEDQGVSTTRTFRIPAPGDDGLRIDEAKPARLRKHLDFRGTSHSFEAINGAKAADATLLGGTALTIGDGARSVSIRFGTETRVRPADIEAFISLSRQVLGNESADVVLNIKSLDFASGHDLEAFLTKSRIEVAAGEVEQ
jgi:hypothetical protein